ncbi:DUF3563 family protein [Pleomorphomonas sp. NRK KF1]|uniref:DUF3563 family protein n=1 Tax=Pleomorphomonas sp. NRK KF1 TaxID=2943000 RepID=UPI0020437C57|nr:DUF3563 family protein [Pleomorphomonas sp. NRK KF1]MCM5552308.1 DUF3563 domain-containing protein [Pleomorphomonas sp. NRK KF1]
MFANLKKAIRSISASEREAAYLNEAGDRIDLELRQREVDRGLFRRNRNLGL